MIDLVEQMHLPLNTSINCVKSLLAQTAAQGFRTDIPPVQTTLEDNPPNLQLFLTHKCNLHCTHCYASTGTALAKEIITADWIEVLYQFSTMQTGNIVTFTGGEPLVHPEFDTIARHAKNLGNRIYLLTNGVAINSVEKARSLAEFVDFAQLSFEGTTAEIHDKIRGKESFRRAIEGLNCLLSTGIPVEIVKK